MKTSAILFFLVLVAFSASSQDNDYLKKEYEVKITKYNRMRSAGKSMIYLGSGLAVNAAGLVIYSNYVRNDNQHYASDTEKTAFLVMGGSALAFLTGGVILNMTGKKRLEEYNKKLKNIYLGIHPDPGNLQISVIYRF